MPQTTPTGLKSNETDKGKEECVAESSTSTEPRPLKVEEAVGFVGIGMFGCTLVSLLIYACLNNCGQKPLRRSLPKDKKSESFEHDLEV